MKLLLLLIAGLILAVATVQAAGCPPGTKQHCAQGKGGVTCTCR
jgi:hypothetical protein